MTPREALAQLVQWMDDSGLSSTKPGGVGVIRYEGTEYSVVTDARAALAHAESPCQLFLNHCTERQRAARSDRDREFWQRLAGSVRKAAAM